MQATEKIWMNGELIDWDDAKIHVGSHGLHYGTGVFEGIRCYDTPQGPAVFRLRDHLERLHNSAKLLYMQLPYSVDELRDGVMELIARTACRRATSARSRSTATASSASPRRRQPGRGRDDELAVGHVPRRRRAAERHPRRRSRSWQRVGPNVIPHVAKATGIYLNSMLAVTEANNAGYDEAIMLTHDGYVADGSGENIFVVKDGVLYTPDLADGDPAGHHAQHGHPDRAGPRLHGRGEEPDPLATCIIADEVFMCGTAAEVTPIREIDDIEIGVGRDHEDDPEGVPRDGERQRRDRPVGAVARSGRELRRAPQA